jgi:hypothetical protein
MSSVEIPFPVEVPYAMRPNMRPWNPLFDQSILTTDVDFNWYQSEKSKHYDPVYGDNASTELVYKSAQALRSYDPSAPVIEGDAPVWQLTKSLQEDFVIWAPNKVGDLSAQILSVCLPSGWSPKDKVNKTFLEIHEPIPDFDTVNRASNHIAKMITERGPFIRHVWSICNRPGLSRRPDLCQPWANETVDDMWFRTERQITVPVDGTMALFLIRVYMQPLRDILRDPDKTKLLIDSIMSMTDAVIEYKGFGYLKQYFSYRTIT